jgi:hypothetical protein
MGSQSLALYFARYDYKELEDYWNLCQNRQDDQSVCESFAVASVQLRKLL